MHKASIPSSAVSLLGCLHFPAGCIMSLRLRSPLHHAPDFCFLSLHTQGKHTSFGGILAWQSPLFRQAASCRSGSALRSIMHLISVFSPSTHRARIPPSAVSLLDSLHFFPTQSLTECAPFLRTYRIPPLRSGSALTQALLCNPCPLPPRSPALLIYFFSKFSFSCGSTGSLKSAFIIEGLSVLEEQVSPEHLKTHFVAFETLRLT